MYRIMKFPKGGLNSHICDDRGFSHLFCKLEIKVRILFSTLHVLTQYIEDLFVVLILISKCE
jgi:hypothetical protein